MTKLVFNPRRLLEESWGNFGGGGGSGGSGAGGAGGGGGSSWATAYPMFSTPIMNSMPRGNASALLQEIANKIHHEEEPAIKLDDGTVMWFWHGWHVPRWFIKEPELITPTMILKTANIEHRRLLIERFGIGRFMAGMGGKMIAKDKYGLLWIVKRNIFIQHYLQAEKPKDYAKLTLGEIDKARNMGWSETGFNNEEILRLTRIRNDYNTTNNVAQDLFGDRLKIQFVQVKDASTNRIYFLQVPSTIKTAKAAVSWGFNMKEEDYEPDKET